MNLRFELRVMTEDGECIVSDFTTIDPARIDQFGGCEAVDHAAAKAMRCVRSDLIAGKLEPEAA